MNSASETIVVGLSGGVDSSVSAALLKEQGHNVIGLFMKNWEETGADGHCPAEQDAKDAALVCEKLGIPFYAVNFSAEYQENVFKEFLAEYRQGHTPNPDILCNKEIKFKVFYQAAKKLGATKIATGHYCQTFHQQLLKGVDAQKDQSYFLYAINANVLNDVIFPIGHLEKSEVRNMAEKYQFLNAKKKDSTGICFIGERDFSQFLQGYIQQSKGEFKTLDGESIGQHQGSVFYTRGQRKGLGLGGQGDPWYVVDKDLETNTVFVHRGKNHPQLFNQVFYIDELNGLHENFFKSQYRCSAKIRYRQDDQGCVVEQISDQQLRITFDEPQWAGSIKQSIVLYDQKICLGGGQIASMDKLH
jgi:tRNA-specific 2-thiouridylase